jgi:hypothetical protein
MKKLSPLNARFITETFFPQYKDKPQVINYGQCFQWAYIAFHLFEDVELWDTHTHAFIKYKGKFYDSERPDGVLNWRDLPQADCRCKYCSNAVMHDECAFKKEWRHASKTYGIKWIRLRKQVKQVLEQKSEEDHAGSK